MSMRHSIEVVDTCTYKSSGTNRLNATVCRKEEKTKQQLQLLSENEEDFLPFPTTYIVDMTTEEAGRVHRQTKTF